MIAGALGAAYCTTMVGARGRGHREMKDGGGGGGDSRSTGAEGRSKVTNRGFDTDAIARPEKAAKDTVGVALSKRMNFTISGKKEEAGVDGCWRCSSRPIDGLGAA